MKRILMVIASVILSCGLRCEAQRFSISTNLLGYAALGTMNIEGAYSVSRYVSVTAGFKYNPFTFGADVPEEQIQLRQRSCGVGLRVWPWHTWSGWWMAAKGRWQEYNMGGITSPATDEGDRIGLGLYAGYTHMVGPHFNIEFGLGAWGGLDWFTSYSCQTCGVLTSSGRRGFVLPDDIMVSLVYVF